MATEAQVKAYAYQQGISLGQAGTQLSPETSQMTQEKSPEQIEYEQRKKGIEEAMDYWRGRLQEAQLAYDRATTGADRKSANNAVKEFSARLGAVSKQLEDLNQGYITRADFSGIAEERAEQKEYERFQSSTKNEQGKNLEQLQSGNRYYEYQGKYYETPQTFSQFQQGATISVTKEQQVPDGYRPVIVGGKITGYEDLSRGISIPANQFKNYLNKVQVSSGQSDMSSLFGMSQQQGIKFSDQPYYKEVQIGYNKNLNVPITQLKKFNEYGKEIPFEKGEEEQVRSYSHNVSPYQESSGGFFGVSKITGMASSKINPDVKKTFSPFYNFLTEDKTFSPFYNFLTEDATLVPYTKITPRTILDYSGDVVESIPIAGKYFGAVYRPVSEFVPTTPLGLGLTVGTIGVGTYYPIAGKAVGFLFGGYSAFKGGKEFISSPTITGKITGVTDIAIGGLGFYSGKVSEKRIITRAGKTPKVSVENINVDTIKIGELEDGTSLWNSKSKAEVIIKDPYTGKIKVIEVVGESKEPVKAINEGDATRVLSKNMEYFYYDKNGARVKVNIENFQSKASIKAGIIKSEGEYLFVEGKEGGVIESAKAETTIFDYGKAKMNINLNLKEQNGKVFDLVYNRSQNRVKPVASTRSNIQSKFIAERESTFGFDKGGVKVEVPTQESFFINRIISGVSRENYRVRGYARKTYDWGIVQIRRVSPTLRKYSKEQRPSESFGVGVGRARTPTNELRIDFGFKESGKGTPSNINENSIAGENQLSKQLSKTKQLDKQRQSVQASSSSEVKSVSDLIAKNISEKPVGQRTKKIKVESKLSQPSKITSAFGFGSVVKTSDILVIRGNEKTKTNTIESSMSKSLSNQESSLSELQTSKNIFSLGFKEDTQTRQRQLQTQTQNQQQRQRQIQTNVSKQILSFGFSSPTPPPRVPIRPNKEIPIIPKKPKSEKEFNGKNYGYLGYVKQGSKFVKVTSKPTSRENALSASMRLADMSSSRQFKIQKTNKMVKPEKKVDTYYKNNSYKFRFFKQTRGQKSRIVNGGIEKSKYAIDTPTEKNQITVRGLLSKRRASGGNVFRF